MEKIYKNYDGALYIVVAKSLYEKNLIDIPEKGFILSVPLSYQYFFAHLPVYPLLIRLISQIGLIENLKYLKAMVLVNVIFTVFLVWFFYFLLKKFKITSKPFLLSIIFLFLPRFLVVRSVGAPESIFIFFILLSLYFFEKERYWLAGLFGGLAVATKTPGILLFGGYCLVFVERLLKGKKINWQWLGVLLIPLGLLTVFGFYYLKTGDFLAYFHSGDNIHLVYPFSVFNYTKVWVGTAWLEEIIFYYFLYGLTVYSLKNSKLRSFFYFSLLFFIAIIFVEHRDISRYSLPLWPMALISFEKFFTSRKFLTTFFILLIGIFFYAINFASANLMPISDWKAFL